VVRSPPLYGVAAGLLVNITGLPVPGAVADPVAAFGAITPVLITLGVGLLFEPVGAGLGRPLTIAGTRLLTGVLVAVGVVLAFGLEGLDRTIVLLLGMSPVAFVSVTFAALENLDTRLAVNALSLSMAASFVLSVGIVLVTA
jgi:predicted permease